MLTKVRRSIASLPSARTLDNIASSGLWLTGLCGIAAFLISVGYDVKRRRLYDVPTNGHEVQYLAATILPFAVRFLALYLRRQKSRSADPNLTSDQNPVAFAMLWTAGHLWAFEITRKVLANKRSPWRPMRYMLCGSSALRAVNGFILGYGRPLGAILLTVSDILCSAFFKDFDNTIFDESCSVIGPKWHFHINNGGHYLNTTLGILFLTHLTLGGSILGLTGDPFINLGHLLEPFLGIGQALFVACLPLWGIVIWFDHRVHLARHNGCPISSLNRALI